MADQDLLTKTFELTGTVYAVGALGAALRLRQTGQSGDARVLAKLEAVTESIAPGLLSDADPAEIGAMSDYKRIKRWSTATFGKRKRLRPIDTIALHRQSKRFIEAELASPFDGPTVVVTHHAPTRESLALAGRDDLDWCYASDLSALMKGPGAPDVWIHGHIHQHQDYAVGATRVVANPRGYRFLPDERDIDWDPGFVVEVDGYEPRPPVC